MIQRGNYRNSVFINCSFDRRFRPIFHSLVFSVYDCGFVPRSALEFDNASQNRHEKIVEILRVCQFAIHDISNVTIGRISRLPRFNMPYELGLFAGAREFGKGKQREKCSLIFERNRYELQKCLSDLAGVDARTHDHDSRKAISNVRDWLSAQIPTQIIPGGIEMFNRYSRFQKAITPQLEKQRIQYSEMTFVNYCRLVEEWLRIDLEATKIRKRL